MAVSPLMADPPKFSANYSLAKSQKTTGKPSRSKEGRHAQVGKVVLDGFLLHSARP
jgi:hypothetical protein